VRKWIALFLKCYSSHRSPSHTSCSKQELWRNGRMVLDHGASERRIGDGVAVCVLLHSSLVHRRVQPEGILGGEKSSKADISQWGSSPPQRASSGKNGVVSCCACHLLHLWHYKPHSKHLQSPNLRDCHSARIIPKLTGHWQCYCLWDNTIRARGVGGDGIW